jgi:hypothetical protein
MLQVSLLAYVTGAMFLSLAYLELVYHLLALGVCLEVASRGEAELAAEELPMGAAWLAPMSTEAG